MHRLVKPQNARWLFALVTVMLSSPAALLAADEYTGQFMLELEADQENLDKVVFQPATGRLPFNLPPTLGSGANVTFSFLYNPHNEKLEVPALLVEEQDEPPYLWVDANLNKSFEETEKVPLERDEEDNPYIWEGTVNIPLQKGVFKTFPLFVKFFRGVKWDEMNDDDRLILQSNEVYARGFVDIQGKKTLVEYSYNPRERKISLSRSKVGIDCNGDGEIDWGRFSGEAAVAEEESVVFRVGEVYVSNKKADVEKNVIVLKSHPATDYKRLELRVGDLFPDFEYRDFKGKKRRLSEFRGKYVLLDFWAIWCGPCRREMPYQKAAYQRYNARGFEILGMNADEADYVPQVRSWLEKNKLDWTQATRESITPIMRALRIHFYPTTLLLDPEGKVLSLDERKKGQLGLRGKELLESLQSIFFPTAAESRTTQPAGTGSGEVRPSLRTGTTSVGNIRLPEPPSGFKWRGAERLRLFCAVPDGWKYKEEARGEEVVITIGEDNTDPVEVVITAHKRVSGSAIELATTMLQRYEQGKRVVGKHQNQFGDLAQILLVLQEDDKLVFYVLVANTKTNSLRVGTFACPPGRMSEIGQKAQTVLNQVVWVE